MLTEIERDAKLSRFLISGDGSHINREKQVVKSSLFAKKHPKGFSVFKTTDIDEEEIWNICKTEVTKNNPEKEIYGRCDIMAGFYLDADLQIILDEPPVNHYCIYGMPVGALHERSIMLQKRQTLVANSKFVPYAA